jgi:tRNA modification GTPase
VDGSLAPEGAHRVPVPEGKRGHLLVLNKADLGVHPGWGSGDAGKLKRELHALPLSCETGEGIEALRAAMRDAVWEGADSASSQLVAINARHQTCFQSAANALAAARAAMEQWTAPEFVALDVREALQHVGEVTGRVDVEEILGAIFAQFCIGK